MSETDDDLFLTTNLYPRTTGLPMVSWVGPRYGAQHDARIKSAWRTASGWTPEISRSSRFARSRTSSPAGSRRR